MTDTSMPLDFSGLEDRVRSMDPDTSWEAAELIDDESLSQLKKDIIKILGWAQRHTGTGLTDDALVERYSQLGLPAKTPQRIRTSRKELETKCHPPYVQALRDEHGAPVLGSSNLDNGSQVWVLAARS